MPSDTQKLVSQALGHHENGRLEDAWRLYQEALSQSPDNPLVLAMMGVVQQQVGNLQDAEVLLRHAAELDPKDATTWFNLGLTLWQLGRFDDARAALSTCTELAPRRADAHAMLGKVELDAGDPESALRYLKKSVRLDTSYAPGWLNTSAALHELGRIEEALAACRKAVGLSPDDPVCLYNLGSILMDMGRPAEAEEVFRKAITAAPDYIDAWINLANALIRLFRPQDAEESARAALRIDEDHPLANSIMALALTRQGRASEAMPYYERTLTGDPDEPSAISNLACHYLSNGDLERGWPLFERMRIHGSREDKMLIDAPGFPVWQGEPPEGKRFLVTGEQGIGEQILFGGLLPELRDRGAEITYVCESRLVPILRRSLDGMTIADAETWEATPATDFDFFAPVGTLATLLRRERNDFERRQAYLRPDPELTKTLRTRYQTNEGEAVIGISWRSASPVIGLAKNVPLALWQPVFERPGCRFVSVQYGDAVEECRIASEQFGIEIVVDPEIDALKSIEQNAAQIAACDMIVSVSNAGLHIAGAAGIPACALIGRDPNWYWGTGLGADRSLWYESVRVFRQSPDGDWRSAVRRVASTIAEHLSPPAEPD